MIRYIKKNKILFCFTLIINLLTCLTPLFLAYIIENVSGIFLNQDESKIIVSLWLIIAFMIYQALFSYLNSRYKAKYRQKLRADLSKDKTLLDNGTDNQQIITFELDQMKDIQI